MIWMGRVPNQKRIITHRIACDGNIPYTVRCRDIEAYAARTLNDAGFKMWLYMSANKDGYDYNLSAAAVEKEYGIKVKQYRNGIQNLIDNDFLVAIGDSNDFNFIEYPVYTSRIDEKDKTVDNDKNQIYETSVMPSRIDGEKENKDKNSVYTPRTDAVVPSRIDASIPHVQTSSIRHVQRNNIDNIIDNINNNIELSSHNSSTKVENCFKESHVYTSRTDGENGNMANSRSELPARKASVDNSVHIDKVVQVDSSSAYVLSKDELRPIHTSDGAVVELPIRNILDGLKDALTNKKNESTIKEIREKCDLTEKQKKEIDDTLDFWELDW